MTDQVLTTVDERWRSRLDDGPRSLAWSPLGRLLVVAADGRALIDRPDQTTAPMAPDPVDAAWRDERRVVVVDTVAGAVFAGSGDLDVQAVGGARCVGAASGRTVIAGTGIVAVFHGNDDMTPSIVRTGIGHSHVLRPLGGALWAVGGTEGLAFVDASLSAVDSRLELEGTRALACSPWADRLAIVDAAGRVHLVELARPDVAIELEAETTRHVAISDEGDLLVTTADNTFTWWWFDTPDPTVGGRRLEVLQEATITAMAMSSDRIVATGDSCGTLRLWSPRLTDYPVATHALESEILDIEWAPGSHSIAVAAMTGDVAVLDVTPGALA